MQMPVWLHVLRNCFVSTFLLGKSITQATFSEILESAQFCRVMARHSYPYVSIADSYTALMKDLSSSRMANKIRVHHAEHSE